jgi:hypothetical protein
MQPSAANKKFRGSFFIYGSALSHNRLQSSKVLLILAVQENAFFNTEDGLSDFTYGVSI